ncbi:MAG TPA: helicase-exonuclease AddAB subunit AddA [Oscillospiraceae bacterium]|nr:helicase-exonuclease AddAB subunit AddA [Oscillospiraceae bacterium]
MSGRNWTQGQQDAINARGGTLLVSAAAGSGKTAVLVQRVIERLTDKDHPSNADRLLVVTFTKAAAAEMRDRISQSLTALLAQDPTNVNLQRQQILLTRANISTVHGFCSELVRENFYKLNISPDFRISDDSEMALLRSDAITRVLEEYYAQDDTVFSDLVEAFSSDRDDSRIIETVDHLYDFVRSHPFPKKWLEEKAAMYQPSLPAGQTEWGKTMLDFASGAADYCISITNNSLLLMQEDEKINAAYEEAFQSDLAELNALQKIIAEKDWDAISQRVNSISFARLKNLRGYNEDELKIRLNGCRKEVKDTVCKLAKLFCVTQQECKEDLERLAPMVAKLFEITNKFSDTLDELKAERRAADFGDLEHWALRLLVRSTENGYERTEDAIEFSHRFDEVMVDEYQDTNEAQDMLFRAISQDENNLFMVGDVKQSIYSFRQAMPKIFLERRESFPQYDRNLDHYPAYLVLDKNFRSRAEVTDAVNFVFGQLMSPETGDIAYTEQEKLVVGADYLPQAGCETQLEIIDSSIDDTDDDAMELVESRRIAELIAQTIHSGFLVTEGGKQRSATYRDFCILLRSANKYAPEYAKELQQNAIPAWADTTGGFFATTEIAVMLSLLRVIDNPIQDIPLLAVLMSPIYGFTADDMADIRLKGKGLSLYLAVLAYAEENEHAKSFLNEIEQYRILAATMPSDSLINSLYQKTGYLNMVQTMQNGELRLANLRLLLEYAKKYESSGYNGLSGFIRFIDRLQKQQSDLAPASTISESANVVRVMSIHKSKGLEFPICIIAGCSRRFNKERGDALLHPALGLGVKLKDNETLCRYTTLPREAIALEMERESMSEELRILYVAMTRAKEKLILLTTVKDLDKTLGKLAAQLTSQSQIQPYVVRSASNISDWLLFCALRHPSGQDLRERALAQDDIICRNTQQDWTIHVSAPPEQLEQAESVSVEQSILPDEKLLQTLKERIGYHYPYADLRGIPAKVAASELAAEEFTQQFAVLSRPAFMSSSGLTPAERGTALHAYMQFADYAAAAQNPQVELERLVIQGYLTVEQGAAVDIKRIQAFFAGNTAKRILASNNVLREFRFTVEIPANMVKQGLIESLGSQPVVLQGAVDCAFEEEGGIVIVDYKTDKTASADELWQRYRMQLDLYRLAMEQSTKLPVKECLLYSFHLNSIVRG